MKNLKTIFTLLIGLSVLALNACSDDDKKVDPCQTAEEKFEIYVDAFNALVDDPSEETCLDFEDAVNEFLDAAYECDDFDADLIETAEDELNEVDCSAI
ncbi:MAG: hypothetical protein O9340_10525 [Cyclobacteriaceae bacterium]|jgi:hypothetical protein|nr:hypothetical protein [Cyclobacteriaceae bacterium]